MKIGMNPLKKKREREIERWEENRKRGNEKRRQEKDEKRADDSFDYLRYGTWDTRMEGTAVLKLNAEVSGR